MLSLPATWVRPWPAYQLWPASQAEATSRWGITPANIYRCQDLAAQLTDAVAGQNLLPQNGPSFGVPTPFPKRVAVSFAAATTQQFAGAFFDDDGLTSQGFLLFLDIPAGAPTLALFCKDAAPLTGPGYYGYYTSTGSLVFRLRNAAGTQIQSLVTGHAGGYFGPAYFLINYATLTLQIYSLRGSSTVNSIAGVGACPSPDDFRLGVAPGVINAGGQTLYQAMRFVGANADGPNWAVKLPEIWKGPS